MRRGAEDRRIAASKLTAEAAKDEGLGESTVNGDRSRAGAEASKGAGENAESAKGEGLEAEEDAELNDLPPQSDDDIIGGD